MFSFIIDGVQQTGKERNITIQLFPDFGVSTPSIVNVAIAPDYIGEKSRDPPGVPGNPSPECEIVLPSSLSLSLSLRSSSVGGVSHYTACLHPGRVCSRTVKGGTTEERAQRRGRYETGLCSGWVGTTDRTDSWRPEVEQTDNGWMHYGDGDDRRTWTGLTMITRYDNIVLRDNSG
jgi:hypothetical protein